MAALAKNALILVSEFGCPHVFLTLTCNPKWPEIMSQLLDGQTAFDRPEVTAAVFKSRLDLMKMNIRNGKYFDGCELIYTFHVIEYKYRGLPHAHLVVRLDDAHDIDDPNREDLIYSVKRLKGKNIITFTRRMGLQRLLMSTNERQLKLFV